MKTRGFSGIRDNHQLAGAERNKAGDRIDGRGDDCEQLIKPV